jgi:hypothetical protein
VLFSKDLAEKGNCCELLKMETRAVKLIKKKKKETRKLGRTHCLRKMNKHRVK